MHSCTHKCIYIRIYVHRHNAIEAFIEKITAKVLLFTIDNLSLLICTDLFKLTFTFFVNKKEDDIKVNHRSNDAYVPVKTAFSKSVFCFSSSAICFTCMFMDVILLVSASN